MTTRYSLVGTRLSYVHGLPKLLVVDTMECSAATQQSIIARQYRTERSSYNHSIYTEDALHHYS